MGSSLTGQAAYRQAWGSSFLHQQVCSSKDNEIRCAWLKWRMRQGFDANTAVGSCSRRAPMRLSGSGGRGRIAPGPASPRPGTNTRRLSACAFVHLQDDYHAFAIAGRLRCTFTCTVFISGTLFCSACDAGWVFPLCAVSEYGLCR